jgi:drug/metabolite transporter (DMT)-like permease
MLSGCLAFSAMATMAHALRIDHDWQVVAGARTGLAMIFAAILAGRHAFRWEVWTNATLWVRSIAGSVSLVGTFYAYSRVPVSDVLTLTNLFPVWVAFLSWPLLKERPSPGVWISVVVSIVGVVLIQQPHFAEENFATLTALASSFFTAVAMIGLHRLAHVDARAIVVHFSAVALATCVLCWFLFESDIRHLTHLDSRTLLLLLAIGVAATIGQLFLTKAFAAGPPARVSVVGLSQIVFAMILEVIFFQREYEPITLAGMVLVMAPAAWLMTHRGDRTVGAAADLPLTAEECEPTH